MPALTVFVPEQEWPWLAQFAADTPRWKGVIGPTVVIIVAAAARPAFVRAKTVYLDDPPTATRFLSSYSARRHLFLATATDWSIARPPDHALPPSVVITPAHVVTPDFWLDVGPSSCTWCIQAAPGHHLELAKAIWQGLTGLEETTDGVVVDSVPELDDVDIEDLGWQWRAKQLRKRVEEGEQARQELQNELQEARRQNQLHVASAQQVIGELEVQGTQLQEHNHHLQESLQSKRVELDDALHHIELARAAHQRVDELRKSAAATHQQKVERLKRDFQEAIESATRNAEASFKQHQQQLASARRDAETARVSHHQEVGRLRRNVAQTIELAKRNAEAAAARHRQAIESARQDAEAARVRHQQEMEQLERDVESATMSHREEIESARRDAAAADLRHQQEVEQLRYDAELARREVDLATTSRQEQIESVRQDAEAATLHHQQELKQVEQQMQDARQVAAHLEQQANEARVAADQLRRQLEAQTEEARQARMAFRDPKPPEPQLASDLLDGVKGAATLWRHQSVWAKPRVHLDAVYVFAATARQRGRRRSEAGQPRQLPLEAARQALASDTHDDPIAVTHGIIALCISRDAGLDLVGASSRLRHVEELALQSPHDQWLEMENGIVEARCAIVGLACHRAIIAQGDHHTEDNAPALALDDEVSRLPIGTLTPFDRLVVAAATHQHQALKHPAAGSRSEYEKMALIYIAQLLGGTLEGPSDAQDIALDHLRSRLGNGIVPSDVVASRQLTHR